MTDDVPQAPDALPRPSAAAATGRAPPTGHRAPGVIVYGAGGHGKVVAEVVGALGLEVEGFLDDLKPVGTPVLGEKRVLGGGDRLAAVPEWAVVIALAIGDNAKRQALAGRLAELGRASGTFVHPRAWVSPTATLGPGTVVMAGAVVNAAARVGAGVILNTGCTVEHDCVIGDFAHLSPRSVLGGAAHVGAGAHIGLGACVLPQAIVEENALVGAGAVVLAHVNRGQVVVGVPARPLRTRG
jgi:sugar O-acyltransferase (sialic acid O-acetyltransferase NeuD family)